MEQHSKTVRVVCCNPAARPHNDLVVKRFPVGGVRVVCVRADWLPIAFVRVPAFVQLPETSVAAQLGSLLGKHSTAAISATFMLSVRAE
jgi:hypothetical protein